MSSFHQISKLLRRRPWWFIPVALLLLVQCNPDGVVPDDQKPAEVLTGLLEVEFAVPEFHILPSKRIHRANLCVAYTPDSLFRKEYLDCANTSDVQETYQFVLAPGTYYYQAGLTCSARGDSCLWGGFPNGYLGMQWAITRVVIERNKTTLSSPIFQ